MLLCELAGAAIGLAALVGHSSAIERAPPPMDRAALVARLTSDSWSERRSAERELRGFSVDNVALLRHFAADSDARVRVAAVDALSAWLRGDDEARSTAARDALTELSNGKHDGAKLAAARLDGLLAEVERSVLDGLTTFNNPRNIFT
jgi:hypothetical protein